MRKQLVVTICCLCCQLAGGDDDAPSAPALEQEHSQLLSKVAQLQQEKWTLEEKVLCVATTPPFAGHVRSPSFSLVRIYMYIKFSPLFFLHEFTHNAYYVYTRTCICDLFCFHG